MTTTPLALHPHIARPENLAGSYLLVSLGREWFGIAASRVQEIFLAPETAPVPHPAGGHRATLTLKGQTVPVIDLRRKGGDGYVVLTKVALSHGGWGVAGLMVDDADTVAEVTEEEIKAPSRFGPERPSHMLGVAKINDRITTLLDVDRVAFGDDLEEEE